HRADDQIEVEVVGRRAPGADVDRGSLAAQAVILRPERVEDVVARPGLPHALAVAACSEDAAAGAQITPHLLWGIGRLRLLEQRVMEEVFSAAAPENPVAVGRGAVRLECLAPIPPIVVRLDDAVLRR